MDTAAEVYRRILEKPTATVPETARVLGLSRSGTYEAARRRDIPSVRSGRRVVIPTAWIRAVLEVTA